GFGSYGRGLLAEGYDWLGVEVNPADCAELARRPRPPPHPEAQRIDRRPGGWFVNTRLHAGEI
ncbi:MAG: hypothetical protein ACKOTF_15540, partial [Opitutaceae bacterium]